MNMNDNSPCANIASGTASTPTTGATGSSAKGSCCTACATSDESDADSQSEPFQQNDVLLGRGKKFRHHPGYKMYADLIKENREGYFSHSDFENRARKRCILASIVDRILEHGRFLKFEGQEWVLVTREQALLKTAQAMQYRQRITMRDGAKKVRDLVTSYYSNLEELYRQEQAPRIPMLGTTETQLGSVEMPWEQASRGHAIWNQPPFMAGFWALQHMSSFDYMVPRPNHAVSRQFSVDNKHGQYSSPQQRLPGRRSCRSLNIFRTRRGPSKAPKVPKAPTHYSRECNTGPTKLSSSNYNLVTVSSNGDGYCGFHGNDEIETLPGLIRVTSIGSFVTVDEPMDVSRSDMNW